LQDADRQHSAVDDDEESPITAIVQDTLPRTLDRFAETIEWAEG
jgi:hypothetical protein